MTNSRIRAAVLVYLAASALHYADNTVRYQRYVTDHPNVLAKLLPAPIIALGYFVFAGFGLWGLAKLGAGHARQAAVRFGLCSLGGFVTLLHFTEISPRDLDVLMAVGVYGEIVAGALLLALAVTVFRREAR